MVVSLERQTEVSIKTQQFTDEELLMELRHRGRLKRLEGQFIQEGWRKESGPPEEYIFRRMCREIGDEIGLNVAAKKLKLPGQKVEQGHFLPGPYTSRHLDIKYRVVLNFVVEK